MLEVKKNGADDLYSIVAAINAQLKGVGASFSGVGIIDPPRTDSDVTNRHIVDELIDNDRDFFAVTRGQVGLIAESLWVSISEITRDAGMIKPEMAARKAKMRSVKILKSMMTSYAKLVIENIEKGRTATGRLKDLSQGYKEWKAQKYGSAYPIGVASRQLLRALASGVIRVFR